MQRAAEAAGIPRDWIDAAQRSPIWGLINRVEVLDAIRSVLPDAAPRDLDRAMQLGRRGPPAEEVGLEPFAPPESVGARR